VIDVTDDVVNEDHGQSQAPGQSSAIVPYRKRNGHDEGSPPLGDDQALVVAIPPIRNPTPRAAKTKKNKTAEVQEEPRVPPSDKWICCVSRKCPVKKLYILATVLVADGKHPPYDQLAVGENRLECNGCGTCTWCGYSVQDSRLSQCDNAVCKKHVCFDCLDIAATYAGYWWCADVCRARYEKPRITGNVLPFCMQNIFRDDKPRKAFWAMCVTCGITVCFACAGQCHSGHQVQLATTDKEWRFDGRAICRCGQLKCCVLPDFALKVVELTRTKYVLAEEREALGNQTMAIQDKDNQLLCEREVLRTEHDGLLERWRAHGGAFTACLEREIAASTAYLKGVGTPQMAGLRKDRDAAVQEVLRMEREREEMQKKMADTVRRIAELHQQINDGRAACATFVERQTQTIHEEDAMEDRIRLLFLRKEQ